MSELAKKICLIGDFGVGKTSLVRRCVSNIFSDDYITTVGVKIETKIINLDHENSLKLIIWDIAGTDNLDNLKMSYLQGASGYILVADGTRRNTLTSALALKQEVDLRLNTPPYQLLLNKADLLADWELEEDDYLMLKEKGIHFRKSSALTGFAVEEAFEKLARAL